MKRASSTDGYVLLYKNSGETSFDALRIVKKALGTGRVGHTGTLDKFAEGLLVVFVGRATKLVQWFTACDKVYKGSIRFGTQTDTLDPEGSVIAEAPAPDEASIRAILPSFTGPQIQIPPAYSSIHIDGRRAHELVRNGQDPQMHGRQVIVHELKLLSYNGQDAEIQVRCSKGTYIRSLARDIALAAGSRAYLNKLERLEVGSFSVESAYNPSLDSGNSLARHLQPLNRNIFEGLGFALYEADTAAMERIMHGRPLQADMLRLLKTAAESGTDVSKLAAVFTTGGDFAAIIEKKYAEWAYRFVYANN